MNCREIERTVKQTPLNASFNVQVISCHTFIFPFKWDYIPSGKQISDTNFFDRSRLETIDRFLTETKLWEHSKFEIQVDTPENYHTYNEYQYFHAFAREVLAIDLTDQESTFRYRFKLADPENATFQIAIKNYEAAPTIYTLDLKNILATWYDTGTGFIAFFLENQKYESVEDVLRINDFGRRIYPQFLGHVGPDFTEAPKYSFLADSISLQGVLEKEIVENFSYYNIIASLQGEPISLPNHLAELLGPAFKTVSRESASVRYSDQIILSPIIDDRMFTLCMYFNDQEMDRLKVYDVEKNTYAYQTDDFWYAYTFVDPSLEITCKSRKMKSTLLEAHTYDRWVEGSPGSHLFGMSRYSFVILANKGWFLEHIIANHFRYLYFQLAALALMQRSSILRFSDEAAYVSKLIYLNTSHKIQKEKIRDIYTAYLNLTNKVYFREVTPQDQGIEIYDLLRDRMEIDNDLKALQQEIEELHNYAMLLEGEKAGNEAKNLSWIAALFIFPSMVAAIFGFSNFSSDFPFWISLIITLGSIVFGFIVLIVLKRIK